MRTVQNLVRDASHVTPMSETYTVLLIGCSGQGGKEKIQIIQGSFKRQRIIEILLAQLLCAVATKRQFRCG